MLPLPRRLTREGQPWASFILTVIPVGAATISHSRALRTSTEIESTKTQNRAGQIGFGVLYFDRPPVSPEHMVDHNVRSIWHANLRLYLDGSSRSSKMPATKIVGIYRDFRLGLFAALVSGITRKDFASISCAQAFGIPENSIHIKSW